MYLKRLDIHGFKSFAEPVSLEFPEGITCIVGPNGSGKSNLSDAIRWVLGEQSPKTLRGGKMEEIIFAGTESRKQRGMAEVTLVIDNQRGILPVDFQEVAISRRMFRSGESEYAINQTPCRLKDVRELIMDTGMGVEGYSIIGQGKIAEIIHSRAEGRRAMFEEAAGIVKYRSRKEEAQRRLKNAQENLNRVNDILSEIQGRLPGLKEDSEKAEEYLALREEYQKLEINLTIRQVEQLQKKMTDLRGEIQSLSQKLALDQKQREKLEESQRQVKAVLSELEREEKKQREEGLLAENTCQELQRQLQEGKMAMLTLENDLARVIQQRSFFTERMEEEKERQRKLEEEQRELVCQKDQMTANFQKLEMDFQKKKSRWEESNSQTQKGRDEVFALYRELTAGKTELSGLQSLVDSLANRKKEIVDQKARFGEEVVSVEGQLDQAQKSRLLGKEQILEKQGIFSEYETKKEQAKEEAGLLEDRLSQMENKLHQLRTKKEVLEGFQQSYEGFGPAIRFLMGKGKKPQGIYGTVAELVSVPEGMETAFQTALGQSVQYILCDTNKTASEAVAALKREKGGRATFLPVESIRPGRDLSKDPSLALLRKEEGFVGFGTELVKSDRLFSGAVVYLLGRIVITKTLKDAIGLSAKFRGAGRFVTLEGEDVNAGGAITGGASKKQYPNVLQRKNQIAALKKEEEAFEKQKGQWEKEKEISQKNLLQWQESCRRVLEQLQALDREDQKNQADIEKWSEKLRLLRESQKRWDKELLEIQEQEEKTGVMMKALAEKVPRQGRAIQEREEQIESREKAQQEQGKALRQTEQGLHEARMQLQSAERALSELSEGLGKSGREEDRLRLSLSENLRQQEEIAEKKQRQEKGEAALSESYRQAVSHKEAVLEKEKDLREKREEIARRILTLSEKKDALEPEILRGQTRKHEWELRLARLETQAESLKNRLWDHFEIAYVAALSQRQEVFSVSSAMNRSRQLKNRMRELEPVHIGAIEEYRQVSERYEFLTGQKKDLTEAMEGLLSVISDMDGTIRSCFQQSFQKIGIEFEKAFTRLFGGGTARLQAEGEDEGLAEGIEIIVQPPGKRLQNINLLSGGEKSLTAIALMCAMLKVRPTPFCILDEVEAALDEANIGRFIAYLKEFENVQFLVVTHQKATMEQGDVLYGVTMPEKGISRVISLKMSDVDRFTKEEKKSG